MKMACTNHHSNGVGCFLSKWRSTCWRPITAYRPKGNNAHCKGGCFCDSAWHRVNAEAVLKATNVGSVYNDDLRHNPNAYLLDTLTYNEVTSKELSVMDLTAITLCQENNVPVVVFNLNKTGNISKAIRGERVGTPIGGTQNSATARA